MNTTTRNFTAGTAILLIGLSLILAVNLTVSLSVRANPDMRYAAPAMQSSSNSPSSANVCAQQTALAQAQSGNEIWGKASAYYPTTVPDDHTATFSPASKNLEKGNPVDAGELDLDKYELASLPLESMKTHLVVHTDGEWEGESTLCFPSSMSEEAFTETEMHRKADTLWGNMEIQYSQNVVFTEEKAICYTYSLNGQDLSSLTGAAFNKAATKDWLGGPIALYLTGLLDAGEELELVLPSNPSTGYTWKVDLPKENSSVQVEDEEFRQLSSLLGAPGLQTIRIHTTEAQRIHLRLHYQRSWEADVPPTRVLSIDAEEIRLRELKPVLRDWPELAHVSPGTIQWDAHFSLEKTPAPSPDQSTIFFSLRHNFLQPSTGAIRAAVRRSKISAPVEAAGPSLQ